ncbi:cell division protein ZapA [Tranquillimonas rosea]|uniref:cell division protein ZapA n=1 Tax=Tranquillimonas rosea TaxID=641238 RepID=UPI003BAD247C
MADITITIGGRDFQVACQEGEEVFLRAAAKFLDGEASVLTNQFGRLPEGRMLLMAGLMLADKTAGLQEQARDLEEKLAAQTAELEALKNAPAPEPERVEVPVIPTSVVETMAEIAARAESLADTVDEKKAG